jgi:membrane associated rhomboid family serine protease
MITRILIIANVLAFVWEVAYGGTGMLGLFGGSSQGEERVLVAGALIPLAVLQYHQWWRIVTGAFLHGGLLHIVVNMISLWSLGRFIESITGGARMLFIYAVSLVASGICVVYFSSPDAATLGASGAIFGLFGALFAIGFKLGPSGMALVRANVGILVLNLVITFTPGISWQAHVGGLLSGFLLTLLIYYPPRRIAPVVTDAITGDAYDTEYQSPVQPQHPPQ